MFIYNSEMARHVNQCMSIIPTLKSQETGESLPGLYSETPFQGKEKKEMKKQKKNGKERYF